MNNAVIDSMTSEEMVNPMWLSSILGAAFRSLRLNFFEITTHLVSDCSEGMPSRGIIQVGKTAASSLVSVSILSMLESAITMCYASIEVVKMGQRVEALLHQ